LRRRRSPQRSRTALNGHWNPVPEVTVGYVFGGLLDQWFRRQFTGPPLSKPKGRNQRIDHVFVTRPAQQQTSMDDFFTSIDDTFTSVDEFCGTLMDWLGIF
jgi:hypothetical protein